MTPGRRHAVGSEWYDCLQVTCTTPPCPASALAAPAAMESFSKPSISSSCAGVGGGGGHAPPPHRHTHFLKWVEWQSIFNPHTHTLFALNWNKNNLLGLSLPLVNLPPPPTFEDLSYSPRFSDGCRATLYNIGRRLGLSTIYISLLLELFFRWSRLRQCGASSSESLWGSIFRRRSRSRVRGH